MDNSKNLLLIGIPISFSNNYETYENYETEVLSHPWHVSFVLHGEKSPFCAGTLLSDVHVLTAAHCTFGRRPEEFVAIIGDYDWTSYSKDSTYNVKLIQTIMTTNHIQWITILQ